MIDTPSSGRSQPSRLARPRARHPGAHVCWVRRGPPGSTRKGLLPSTVLGVLLAGAMTSVAAQPAKDAAAANDASAANKAEIRAVEAAAAQPEQPLAESARSGARTFAEWVARGVDSWFGDRPFEDGGSVKRGKLTVNVFKRSDQKPDVDVRFDARFKLPNVERRAYLFVGRDDQREAARDASQTRTRQQQLQAARPEDSSLLAGLGFSLPNDVDFRVGLGARAKPYVQARYHRGWELAPAHALSFRETVFWTPDDRLGSTTVGSYALAWSPAVTVRWVNGVTVTQAARGFEWSSSLGAERNFGAQRLLGLELLFNGRAQPGSGTGASDRGVLVRWEQPLYRTWLLGEVVAGHFRPQVAAHAERDRVWAVGAGLKMHF